MKKLFVLFLVLFSTTSFANDCMIGEVRMFAGNFAPRNWAFSMDSFFPVSQHSALFSILGTQFGGDGRSTFALTDMRGRTALGTGRATAFHRTVLVKRQG